jgi:hypothetical protein
MSSNQQRKSPVPLAGETEPKAGAFVSCRHSGNTTSTANNQPRVSVADHDRLRLTLIQAERAAAYACAAIRGRTAEEVALEVASRVINNLTSKTSNPARP